MVSLFRRRASVPEDDWYARATPEELREYNAFGPWIYEVKARDDMPVRFLPWYSELEKASFLLKVPVNKDRRDARPGPDLYRAVVAIDAERLVLLTLDPSGRVDYRSAPFHQIVGLRNFHVLLHAELVFYFADGTEQALTYNAASFPLIERVMDSLSQRIAGKPLERSSPATLPTPPVADPYFQSLMREHLGRHPGYTVVFCEEPGVRYRDERRRRQRSLGLVVLRTATEWLFLDRGSAVTHASDSAYAGSTTWVPFPSSPRFEVAESPLSPKAGREFRIHLGDRTLAFRLFSSPDTLEGLVTHL